ncbi:MAG: hypothetical protein MR274_09535 [Clostridium sp.]|nr:hypothetical protein [Clostridium sp.]
MIDELVFKCEDVDHDYDYPEKFKEVVDKIANYFEEKLGISFEEEEKNYIQAIDIYDCYYISYIAQMKANGYKMIISVPFDQFEIVVINSEKENVIVKYCEIDIEQYTQENLDSMRNIVMEFEQEFDALLMK